MRAGVPSAELNLCRSNCGESDVLGPRAIGLILAEPVPRWLVSVELSSVGSMSWGAVSAELILVVLFSGESKSPGSRAEPVPHGLVSVELCSAGPVSAELGRLEYSNRSQKAQRPVP